MNMRRRFSYSELVTSDVCPACRREIVASEILRPRNYVCRCPHCGVEWELQTRALIAPAKDPGPEGSSS